MTEQQEIVSEQADLFDAMAQLYSLYRAMRVGGFSESEALRLTALYLLESANNG